MNVERHEIAPPVAIRRYRFGPSLRFSLRLPGGCYVTEGQEHAALIHSENLNSNMQAFGMHRWLWEEIKPLGA